MSTVQIPLWASNIDVRAVTLYQPWAWAIGAGYKSNETRSWGTRYRGPLLIHAGRTVDLEFVREVVDHLGIQAAPIHTGAIVAVAELYDCQRGFTPDSETERFFGLYGPDRWVWRLRNVRRLATPVPCGGHQGLWKPDAEIVAAVTGSAGQ